MFGGIEYQDQKVFFPQPDARLNSIQNGKWKPWYPRSVLIVTDQFMEKDHNKQSHWVELDKSMVIQRLLAERNKETKKQRNKETKKQRNKETKKQ